MPDPAEQLQRLYLDGFELQTFERYPNSIGVLRDGCIALVRATVSYAVSITTSMLGSTYFSRSSTSRPDMAAILMSRIATSSFAVLARSIAVAPSAAVKTW